MNQLQEFLDQGFSWRLKEIADLKVVVRGSSSLSQATIIRAGVPLVYAHWEGFVKQASQDYLRYVTGQRLSYQELASCFVVFGAKKHLSGIVESRKSAINIAAVDFFRNKLNERADLALSNAIDAKSNLNYEVFQNIAVSIGISTAPYDAYYNFIDESLLKRRNGIAHGEYLDLSGDDFRALADEVIKLLRMYKTDIEILASNSAYKVV
ncbi:MAE_28990/MAE_18760 family HEPN-like nuclease [Burkholderia pseudomallei]|uniref:MAE_28990/MAE_18760 family HEPN-like nuclease n=1 Tax=Burkholderia pseudomallei TaxID=28450 RepID=UPI00190F2FAF|nr:MAE_28990/MAE_18760 family HEPN-like nuclease [Burkholderia pseudomallei]